MIWVALFVLSCSLPASAEQHALAWRSASALPDELREVGIRALIRDDAEATTLASSDFGNVSVYVDLPAAVLYPSCPGDIAALLRASCARASPFPVSARGCGHSIRGQASAPGAVVVDMPSLGRLAGGSATRLSVSVDGRYIDAGGEQLWVDVLQASIAHGLTPRSWTDYLHLTVGGTLSNAGISGQAYRHGPQISNVQELDVITGVGQIVTCSKEKHADLFDAVLGGLGQFGVITRARIPLVPAPARARWVRLLYTDATALTEDQERLIDLDSGVGALSGLMDYVEGSVLADQGLVGSWRSSFFSDADAARVATLAQEAGGVLYCLEGALYYGGAGAGGESDLGKRLELLLHELRYARGFAFVQDVSYVGFLDRVRDGELKLRAAGLWDVPHPWLNLFLPRSRVLDFAAGVFHGILRRGNTGAMGPVLIYPMNRNRWDSGASAVFPEEEEVFYTVGILRSATPASTDGGQLLRLLEDQNGEIMRFCEEAGIGCVQYLPYYAGQADWEKKHFGPTKWAKFLDFAAGVFHGILRRGNTGAMGPVLIYPMNRNRWDGEASAVFPEEEEVFYTVGILRSSTPASSDGGQLLRRLQEQNEEIMRFCEEAGIGCVQYLPYYAGQAGWEKKHFGPSKWAKFVERKRKYDPKAILSRGQRIFNAPLA